MSKNIAFYDTAQLNIIQSAIEESDFFTAVVLTAIQLERHGYLAIKEYLESLNVNSDLISKLLDRKHLSQIADYLLATDKISKKEHAIIKTINEERNKFLHRRERKEYLRGTEAQNKYTPLVNSAMQILKEKLDAIRAFVSRG